MVRLRFPDYSTCCGNFHEYINLHTPSVSNSRITTPMHFHTHSFSQSFTVKLLHFHTPHSNTIKLIHFQLKPFHTPALQNSCPSTLLHFQTPALLQSCTSKLMHYSGCTVCGVYSPWMMLLILFLWRYFLIIDHAINRTLETGVHSFPLLM